MKKFFIFFAALIFIGGLVKCKGSSEDTSSSNDVTISGTLKSSTTAKSGLQTRAVQLDLYKLYCVTFEESPSSASGDADSAGKFQLTLPGAKDKPFGCFVQSKTTSAIVATLVFQDTSGSSLGGGSQKQGQISLSGDASLGTITLDLDKGIATVDMANITTATTDVSDSDLFDFTGTWLMGPFEGTLPTGYEQMPECSLEGGDGPCYQPGTSGMPIYLLRVPATEGGKSVYGIMVWASEEAFKACGDGTKGALGFNNGDIIGVDFSPAINAGLISDGTFNWSTTFDNGTESGTIAVDNISGSGLPWLLSTAKLQWEMGKNVGEELYTDLNGNGWYDGPEWYDDANSNGQYDQGEYFDDWNGDGVWTDGEPYFEGYLLSEFTDNNSNGIYDDGTDTKGTYNATLDNGQYDWGTWTSVGTVGDLCSSLPQTTDEDKLNALRCYADAYWMTLDDFTPGCFPALRFNWEAGTPAGFIKSSDGPAKARTMFVFEKFIYTGANSGSFTSIEEYENGFDYMRPDGSGSSFPAWARCNIVDKLEMNVTKINDTTMVGDMKITKTLDTSANNDPICTAKGEPFVDANGNGTWDTGETFTDQNGNNTYDPDWTAEEQLGLGVSRVMVQFTKQQ